MNQKEAYNYLCCQLADLLKALEGTENAPLAEHIRELLAESDKICNSPPLFRPGRASRKGSTMEKMEDG